MTAPTGYVIIGTPIKPEVRDLFKVACLKLHVTQKQVLEQAVYDTIQRSRDIDIDYDALLETLAAAEREAGLR